MTYNRPKVSFDPFITMLVHMYSKSHDFRMQQFKQHETH